MPTKANPFKEVRTLECWKIRAIQDETRQALQRDHNAITPQKKLHNVLGAVRSSVDNLFVEANVVQVLAGKTAEGNLHENLKHRLDALIKEDKLIGEGGGATWVAGVDFLSPLLYALFDLQSKEPGSKTPADHSDKVREAMKKVVTQVRLTESHIMTIHDLRVDKYKDAFAIAEKLLNNLNADIDVAEKLLSALNNPSLKKASVEFLGEVPKVQLFEAFEKLNTKLVNELDKADKYAQDIIKLFKVVDRDRNGMISKEELSQMLSQFGQWSPEELDKLFMTADLNHDHFLQYDEFVRWIFSHDSALVDAAEHYAVTMAVFKRYDKDCSGSINAKEMQAFFAEHEGQKIKIEKAKAYIRELDTNGDKKVDCFEFIQYLNRTEAAS